MITCWNPTKWRWMLQMTLPGTKTSRWFSKNPQVGYGSPVPWRVKNQWSFRVSELKTHWRISYEVILYQISLELTNIDLHKIAIPKENVILQFFDFQRPAVSFKEGIKAWIHSVYKIPIWIYIHCIWVLDVSVTTIYRYKGVVIDTVDILESWAISP